MSHLSNLSFRTRKALAVHVGEDAAVEIVQLLQQLIAELEELRRNKVNVTRVVPVSEVGELSTSR